MLDTPIDFVSLKKKSCFVFVVLHSRSPDTLREESILHIHHLEHPYTDIFLIKYKPNYSKSAWPSSTVMCVPQIVREE